jgi:hypothetical protein
MDTLISDPKNSDQTQPKKVSSDRRIAANRRNAKLSTGPRTPEGKARVAQNRLKHGLTGEGRGWIRGEDGAAYENLYNILMEEHQPATETEAHQVELLAHNQWKIRRCAMIEIAAMARSVSWTKGHPELTDEVMRATRYMSAARRSYTMALAELRRLQTARRKQEQLEFEQDVEETELSAPEPVDETKPIEAAAPPETTPIEQSNPFAGTPTDENQPGSDPKNEDVSPSAQ